MSVTSACASRRWTSARTPSSSLAAQIAAVLGLWYPLHRRQVESNVAALKQKHGAH